MFNGNGGGGEGVCLDQPASWFGQHFVKEELEDMPQPSVYLMDIFFFFRLPRSCFNNLYILVTFIQLF